MKQVFVSLISLLMLCVSCTDNDDTGELYGQWQITAIKDNGKVVSSPDNLYLSFQGDIVFARISDHEDYRYASIPGVFEEKKDSLILRFFCEGEAAENIIVHQYLMDDSPTNQRFALTMNSDGIILTKSSRQWQMRKY